MRKLLIFKTIGLVVCLFLTFPAGVFAQTGKDVLQFKARIGFTKGEDQIVEYKFLDDEKKLLLIGEKNLQIWDVESAELLNSVPHEIPQFAPGGFFSTYFLLGLPKLLSWRPFIVDADGKWLITAEKIGDNKLRSAVVRELPTLKQIKILDLPGVSTEYVSFYEPKNEILTFGVTDKNAAMASWDKDTFAVKETVTIKEYKWHQTIRDDRKMIVGSGDTKILWTGLNIKQGDRLTLLDVKTGAIEKEYTAQNLKPGTAYQETTVSSDEKLLISKRDDRIFVWEIDGDGQPKFEISQPDPKGKFSFKEIFDRRYIVVKIDEQLRVYDINGNGAPMLALTPQNPKEDLYFILIVKDRFVVIKADSKLRVYDTQGGQALKFEVVSDNPKDTMEYRGTTENGRYIVVCDDRKIFVLELAGDGKPLYEIVRQSEKERFPVVAFLKDTNFLIVARVNNSEKKEPKTEFYEIPTGRMVFDAAFVVGSDAKFTPDDKYLYQSEFGGFSVWNLAARKLLRIKLETYSPSYDSDTPYYLQESPRNTEYAEFSPDFRYILRYGEDVTAVFDTESGQEIQKLFDTEKVKYDKNKQVKKSGLGEAGWTKDGRFVYAFAQSGFFGNRRTVSFWQVLR